MKPSRLLPLAFLAALTWTAHAAPPVCEVNVNVEVTPEGKRHQLPTKAHPAYYLPIVSGYKEEGATLGGTQPPARRPVTRQLAVTLAEQGYFVVGPHTPPPSVLLVFSWGTMNPITDEAADTDTPNPSFSNQSQMLALVGGHALSNLDLFMEREAVMQGAEEDRYFVIVSAYDFADAQQKKKTLLWRARMSTPSDRVEFFAVAAALIKSGGPFFGRETLRPAWVKAPVENQGKVNLGELTVKEYIDPATPPDKTAKPASKP